MNILATGGAGFVGAQTVRQLLGDGHRVVVLDDLSGGYAPQAITQTVFYRGDIADKSLIARICKEHKVDLVMHFAGYIDVSESQINPLKYFNNNLGKSISLLGSLVDCGVSRFVFSSTAAVYGTVDCNNISENNFKMPFSSYGKSKSMLEDVLSAMADAGQIDAIAVRYFNAAGGDVSSGLGECHAQETHIIPLALAAAMSERREFQVFGEDYDTPDGSCLRDYVHVKDLALAHISAAKRLHSRQGNGSFEEFNLGAGKGYSVFEVLDSVERITGRKLQRKIVGRRSGDPAKLVANSEKARIDLNWSAKHSDLDSIVSDAFEYFNAVTCPPKQEISDTGLPLSY